MAGRGDMPAFAAIAFLLAGPLIWAAHLLFVYGPQSALCARGAGGAVPGLVLAVTLASALALGLILIRPDLLARLTGFRVEGRTWRFTLSVMRLLAALSLFGVLAAGATPLLLDPCAQLR